jgi:hypothetical protein
MSLLRGLDSYSLLEVVSKPGGYLWISKTYLTCVSLLNALGLQMSKVVEKWFHASIVRCLVAVYAWCLVNHFPALVTSGNQCIQ